MGSYRVLFRRSVAKDIRALPKRVVGRLVKTFARLSDNPRGPGCEKLSGQERYRVRQGDYRVIYEIRDEEIVVVLVKVGNRKEVYRGE